MSSSLQPHGLKNARLPCLSPSSGICSISCPLSQRCHPIISSAVLPFSSRLQSFPASASVPMSQLFTSGGQSIGVLIYRTYILCKYFQKAAKYFQEFNSEHKFRYVQYKKMYELFFINFQLLGFAGEEMEAQPVKCVPQGHRARMEPNEELEAAKQSDFQT